jgi:hypothetical protein
MELTESLPQIIDLLKSLSVNERQNLSKTTKEIINRSKMKCFKDPELYEKVREQLEELGEIYSNM